MRFTLSASAVAVVSLAAASSATAEGYPFDANPTRSVIGTPTAKSTAGTKNGLT